MTRTRTHRQREATAYHEAGHAVVAWLSALPFGIISVEPDPDERYAGYVESAWHGYVSENPEPPTATCHQCGAELNFAAAIAVYIPDRDLRSEQDYAVTCICSLFAGGEATRLLTGRTDPVGPSGDLREIGHIADYCAHWGSHTAKTRRVLLQGLQLHTRDLLRTNWNLVTALAAAVLERNEVSEDDAAAVLRAASMARGKAPKLSC